MPDAEGHQDTHRRRRKGHSPRDRAADEQGLPQLPWQQVRNPYPPMRILSDDQVEAIHQTSLRILEELGIELMSPEARAVFRAAGADVDEASGTVLELTHNWDTDRYDLGGGFGHIAIEVDDAYVACEQTRQKGGRVTREAGPMKHGTTVIAFVEDPDGYKIEFIQKKQA